MLLIALIGLMTQKTLKVNHRRQIFDYLCEVKIINTSRLVSCNFLNIHILSLKSLIYCNNAILSKIIYVYELLHTY